MQQFAHLLDNLVYTQSRNRKLALLETYLRTAPDPARGWALAALTDGVPLKLPLRRILSDLVGAFTDPVLYRLSRDYVGDTAETVALLWPDANQPLPPPRLDEVVAGLSNASTTERAALLASYLDRLDGSGRFALLKLIGGAPRVGVSARLAKTALAQAFGHSVDDIEEIWHALTPPYQPLFDWLEGRSTRPDPGLVPVFRPVMLAHPIADDDWPKLTPSDFTAEWKWDGIRVQIAARGGAVRLFTRQGDDASLAFPDIVAAYEPFDIVADGELLVMRDGNVAPFNDLQQRLNRKSVTPKMLREHPAHVRLYDLLFDSARDLRVRPLHERRAALEAWFEQHRPQRTDISAQIPFLHFSELDSLWSEARAEGIEGLMLKRRAGAYLAGRVKGEWYKWKRAPLTLDCVLMYAQRGSGKRSSFYSDYTFGVWRTAEPGTRDLVPVGKAYSGFTDAELKRLDKWIRDHTIDRFGPVRSVTAGLVLEVAFDAVHTSNRHKSGVAMRFPRVHRIRWDKPADEADTLETVLALIGEPSRVPPSASARQP